jgi:hypothetical protein
MKTQSTLWLDAKEDPAIKDNLGEWIRKFVYDECDIIVEYANYEEVAKVISRLKYETRKAYKCAYYGEDLSAVRIYMNGDAL